MYSFCEPLPTLTVADESVHDALMRSSLKLEKRLNDAPKPAGTATEEPKRFVQEDHGAGVGVGVGEETVLEPEDGFESRFIIHESESKVVPELLEPQYMASFRP